MAAHTESTAARQPKQILIVEDHTLIQRMVAEIINRAADLTVCGCVATGANALQMVAHQPVDLVLVDVSLPDMNGIELIESLRKQLPQLPCLVLSGHQEPHYIERALAAGAGGYLAKGNPHEIAPAIRQVLKGEQYLSKQVHEQLNLQKSPR
jgi:DNA-binding NarL/FixJ family response regulator